jgi:hypothetical protein
MPFQLIIPDLVILITIAKESIGEVITVDLRFLMKFRYKAK